MTPIRRDWIDGATRLIRAIDPSMTSTPIYLLNKDEAAAVIGDDPPACCAWTSGTLSRELQGLLQARGEWQGSGFAALFSSSFRRVEDFIATALHEFVHDAMVRPPAERLMSTMTAAAVGAVLSIPVSTTPRERVVDPWIHHDADFARIACHVAYRAHRAGVDVEPDLIWDGRYYGLGSGFSFYCCLESTGEFDELREVALAEVARIKPPAQYRDFATRKIAEARAAAAERI